MVNRQAMCVIAIFKWAAGREILPASVSQSLAAVEPLRYGNTEAKESDPVRPVNESLIAATLANLSPTIKAMVEVQLLTGMRPGELCAMRMCDLDTSQEIWTYSPHHHKTKHRGHDRKILIGPKAQEILKHHFKSNLQAFIFSPADAELRRRAEMHAGRKTPLSRGNSPGTNRKPNPKRRPGKNYETCAYRRAVARACELAFQMPAELRRRPKGEKPDEKKLRLTQIIHGAD